MDLYTAGAHGILSILADNIIWMLYQAGAAVPHRSHQWESRFIRLLLIQGAQPVVQEPLIRFAPQDQICCRADSGLVAALKETSDEINSIRLETWFKLFV